MINKGILEILNTETKEIRSSEIEITDYDIENNFFFYGEGNLRCDCNRGIEFGDKDSECGEGKYKIRITYNGKVMYDELKDKDD
jgi:hypothetical protein